MMGRHPRGEPAPETLSPLLTLGARFRLFLLTGALVALVIFLFVTPFSMARANPETGGEDASYPYYPYPYPKEPPFKLVPGETSVLRGDVFDLAIWTTATAGQPISGVQVFIDFDPSKLQVVDADPGQMGTQISPDTSSLDQVLANGADNGAGSITYAAGTLSSTPPTGSFPVAVVAFRALEATGPSPTTVSFSTQSPRDTWAAYGGHLVYGVLQGARVNIGAAALLRGFVDLQGQARPDPEGWQIPISVAVFPQGGYSSGASAMATCQTTTVRTERGAEFECSFPDLTPGLYDVLVDSEHTLANLRRKTALDDTPPLDFGTLLEGDANDNNIVDILDFTILAASFLKGHPEGGFDPRADFDRTGRVDILDFTLLADNFLRMSPVDVSMPATPLTAWTSLADGNSLIVKVEGRLDRPGMVYVEYWAEGVGWFRTKPVASDGVHYVAYATRLRADTDYGFQVFGMEAPSPDDGTPSAQGVAAASSLDDEMDAAPGPSGVFRSGPLPLGLQAAQYRVVTGKPTKDLTFMDFVTVSPPAENPFNGYVAIDGEGYIVWYMEVAEGSATGPMVQRENGNIIYIVQSRATVGFAIREVTPLGQVVAEAPAPCQPNGPFHHEVQILPPGDRIMILSRDIQDPFNDPERLQEGDTIVIWNQSTGEVTEVWNIFDFVDATTVRTWDSDLFTGPMWRGCSGDEPAQDWTHGNSVALGPRGDYVASFRHLDQVISIAPDFQSLNWRLGGPGGDFTFPNPADKFYHQHSARELPVDQAFMDERGLSGPPERYTRILLFDNGNTRPEAEGGEYSRALELLLDLQEMTATKIWEYRNTPDLFAHCCSNVTRLNNGNTLLVFSSNFDDALCCRTFTIVEADPRGNATWKVELTAPGKIITYRVYPAESIWGEKKISADARPPTAATARVSDENSLVVEVQGQSPSPAFAYIEYGNEEAGTFRTVPVRSVDGRFAARLVRLRPETTYSYQVFGTNLKGDVVPGPSGSFTTGPLPDILRTATFQVIEGAPTTDLTLMEFNIRHTEELADWSGLVAIDGEGSIVWYQAAEASVGALSQRLDYNIVYMDRSFGVREITPWGQEVASLQAPCVPKIPFHHEIFLLPESREVAFVGWEIRDALGNGVLQLGDTIWIWDPLTGRAEQKWSVFDFVDAATDRTADSDRTTGFLWKGCSGDIEVQDWTHGNSVTRAPDGSWIFSARYLDQVMSIAPDFQSLNWRLGGPGGDFTFPEPADKFYHQHSAWVLENGHVLLFDNGNTRPEEEGGEYSRALELALDLENMTATKVWEYRNTPDLYAACCSNVNRLGNGNTLVVFGAQLDEDICCRTFTIVEADPDGNVVWKVEHRMPNKVIQYRVYPARSIMGERRISGVPAAGQAG